MAPTLDRRTLLTTLARAGMVLPVFAAGIAGCFESATAQPKQHPRYHWTLLRTGAPSDLGLLLAALSRTLGHHQLVDAATFAAWAGEGLLPISCTETLANTTYDGRSTRAENPIADVLEATPGKPIRALDISVYAPPTFDLPAYAETVQFVLDMAKAVDAKIIFDSATAEFIEFDEFEDYPKKLESFDVENAHVRIAYSSVRKREIEITGLLKCGLPDVFVPSSLYGETSLEMAKLVVQGLLSGLTIDQGRLTLPRGHAALNSSSSADLVFHLKPDRGRLALSFGDGPQTQQEHQQALWIARLGDAFDTFPLLTRADARDLSLAIARLHATFETGNQTAAQSGQVFVRQALPGTTPAIASNAHDKLGLFEALQRQQFAWHRVTNWDDPSDIKVTAWDGDPHQGGKPMTAPVKGWLGWVLYFLSSDDDGNPFLPKTMQEADIVDILVIRPDGTSEGGEISALAARLAASAPKQ